VIVNGLSASVHPLPLALYSQTGLKPLHYRSLEAGAAKHGIDVPLDTKSRTLFEPVASQTALAITLDDFVGRFGAPPPVHLKIDVDGHEDQVLAGASAALATSVRTLCIEATQADESDDRKEVLVNQLVKDGFLLAETVHHHLDRYPRVFDLLFVRR
jgi:FkbM family methyltransferase